MKDEDFHILRLEDFNVLHKRCYNKTVKKEDTVDIELSKVYVN